MNLGQGLSDSKSAILEVVAGGGGPGGLAPRLGNREHSSLDNVVRLS